MATPEHLLTIKEFAKMMGIHPNTAYKWIESGKVPFVKMGDSNNSPVRIKQSDAYRFQENLTIKNQEKEMKALSKVTVSLREYDRIHLRRSSKMASVKSQTFWNYGYGAILTKTTKEGIVRYYARLKIEKNGKTIYAEHVCPSARNRAEAVKELERRHREYLEGKYNNKSKVKEGRFSQLCDEYLEYLKGGNSFDCRQSCIEQPNGLRSFFGKMNVADITSLEVKGYKDMRKEKMNSASNTINTHLIALKSMLTSAKEWSWELSNPVKDIVKQEFIEKVDHRTRVLSEEEERRLYPELSSNLKLIATIALNTMLREGEILSLEWGNINFKEKKIHITLPDTRTKKHKRTLYMNEIVFRIFQVLKSQNGHSKWIFPSDKTGSHMTEVQTVFKRATERAGIDDLHFHDLRRTCASRLFKAGVPLARISRDLGHSNLRTTQIYIGLTDEEEEENYFKKLDKEYGENQWNNCGMAQVAISNEGVSSTNLMS